MNFWSGKNVLVTGATGMIGSWVVERLISERAGVVAFIRDSDMRSLLYTKGIIRHVNVVTGRLEDYSSVERAIIDYDVDSIFHFGAQSIVGHARRSPLQTFESNVRGTWHVLEAARVHSALVERVIVASSDKAYGEAEELPYREEMGLAGRGPYEVSKSCADLITTSYAMTYKVPVVVARCANIYGGGDLNWSRIVPGTLRSLILGEQPVLRSDGSLIRDYLYVEDAVDAYMTVAEHVDVLAPGEAFNFSSDSPLTVLEVFHEICEAFGQPHVEPCILGQDETKSEIRNQYLSSEKARRQLGWSEARDLRQGLRKTVEWYRTYFSMVTL